jgi:uncharacterized protein DUF3131
MTRVSTTIVLAAILALPACDGQPSRKPATGIDHMARMEAAQDDAASQLARLEREKLLLPDERAVFDNAARVAWSFADHHYQPGTGLMAPLGSYQLATVWDIGSMLSALYSARGLKLISEDVYEERLHKALTTLTRVPLYDGAILNKSYDTASGAMVDHQQGPRGKGIGYSATDLGRLLIWLKVVSAGDPAASALAEKIVARQDLARVIRRGYLSGEDFDSTGAHHYQEGRIGYEQYAAQGFALWGLRAEKALDFKQNALPVTVMGQTVPADYRRWDRLTSEPFLLMGLELGWDRTTAELVRRMLLAQEARYRKTGLMTVAAEDAIDVPPHFFFYYCLYTNGRDWGIDVQDRDASVDGPRWISTKSAFAFHALMPSQYTDLVMQRLGRAETPGGWASGIYERSGESTGNLNINTTAVILTAALVNQKGQPMLPSARRLITGEVR